ncbi:hypothetical protein [Streptomyces purpureus]|uniref:Uncharacterized protein n=1 Tax=Streptomyces purpureus TaxID=1951 RepID=A0A918LND8_9ACTN|nr:hypothetical protein [Streptomyces purpureus]GGT26221.1 hypothetical protein GCM10014713_19130 [Streptomyces purpureus]
MSILHEEYGTDAEIYRKPFSNEVIADCGDPRAHEVLATCGFVKKTVPPHYVWHQLPDGLPEEEQARRATRAACLLRARGFDANVAEDLVSEEAVAAVRDEVRRHRISGAATSSSSTVGPGAPPARPDTTAPAAPAASSISAHRSR